MVSASDLPPDVPPDVYTREYYLTKRHGADEFVATGGAQLSPIHERILNWAVPASPSATGPGRRVLDVGCGCGELVLHAAMRGADAIGADYSPDAIALATEAATRLGVQGPAPMEHRPATRSILSLPGTPAATWPVSPRDPALRGSGSARFHCGDVATLPEGTFDAIILADVVEHLHQHQLDLLYKDLHARLAPGGVLIIHTWPNRWHTAIAYPIARLLLMPFGIRKPKSPRKPHDEIMHVNEQSLWSLKRDLGRHGYDAQVWLEHVMPANAGFVYRATHSWPLVRLFFADHLFALAKISER